MSVITFGDVKVVCPVLQFYVRKAVKSAKTSDEVVQRMTRMQRMCEKQPFVEKLYAFLRMEQANTIRTHRTRIASCLNVFKTHIQENNIKLEDIKL